MPASGGVSTRQVPSPRSSAIALAAWTQRTALDDCVERVREAVGSSDTIAECGFFGQQIDVPVTLAP